MGTGMAHMLRLAAKLSGRRSRGAKLACEPTMAHQILPTNGGVRCSASLRTHTPYQQEHIVRSLLR